MTDLPKGAVWVRLPRFIGDGIMISQSLEPLRKTGIPLVAWGPAKVVELYRGSNAFDGVQADEPAGRSLGVLTRTLRRAHASAVISFARTLRPLLAGWLAGVPLRLGWKEGGGWLLATLHHPWWQTNLHHMDRYDGLLRKAYPHLPTDVPPCRFRPRPEAEAIAVELLRSRQVDSGFVVLALGGNEWNKRMESGPWIDLIHRLKAQGLPAILLGHGPEDQQLAEELQAESNWTVNLVGAVSLAETSALLALARGLVGNDSALVHLAGAVGCPLVAVFGPTRTEWSAPRGPAVRIIQRKDLPCLPCAVHGCAVPGHPCMREAPVDQIWQALQEVLRPAPSLPGDSHA